MSSKDLVVVPALSDTGNVNADQEVEYYGEEQGDLFAPINNNSTRTIAST